MNRPLLLLVAVLVFPLHADAFKVHRHYCMTISALQGQVNPGALEIIAAGAILPDVMGCVPELYCPELLSMPLGVVKADNGSLTGWLRHLGKGKLDWIQSKSYPKPPRALELSRDHFDNNQIEAARDLVNERIREARTKLFAVHFASDRSAESVGDDYVAALLEFGKALHALQDFYAHSTYAECRIPGSGSVDLSSVALWNGSPSVDCPRDVLIDTDPARRYTNSGIVNSFLTGHFIIGPAHTDLHEELASREKPPTWFLHDEIAKDDPATVHGQRTPSGRKSSEAPEELTWYAIVSGQFGAATAWNAPYAPPGFAPHHTREAFKALTSGSPVFAEYPLSERHQSTENLKTLINDLASDGRFAQNLREAASLTLQEVLEDEHQSADCR